MPIHLKRPDSSETLYRNAEYIPAYYDAIVWADKNGIVNGYGDGTFGPSDDITREQLAAIFHRYASYVKSDVSAVDDLSRFTDKEKISGWAVKDVQWAVGSGLVEGKPGNKIDPLGNATRAEAATMMMRYCTEIVGSQANKAA